MAEALRLAPSDARRSPRSRACGASRRSDAAGALSFYDKAVALDPKDLVSRWSAARLRSEPSRIVPRAIRDLEAALEQAPANLFLLLRLCELQRRRGRRTECRGRLPRGSRGSSPRTRGSPGRSRTRRRRPTPGTARPRTSSIRIVENLLRVTPRYQQARHDVDPGVVGLPLEDWGPALAAAVAARAGEPDSRDVRAAVRGRARRPSRAPPWCARAAGTAGSVVFGGPAGLQSARRLGRDSAMAARAPRSRAPPPRTSRSPT